MAISESCRSLDHLLRRQLHRQRRPEQTIVARHAPRTENASGERTEQKQNAKQDGEAHANRTRAQRVMSAAARTSHSMPATPRGLVPFPLTNAATRRGIAPRSTHGAYFTCRMRSTMSWPN